MELLTSDQISGEIFFIKGKKVYTASAKAPSASFPCRLKNINQMLPVNGGLLIKNTSGEIVKYTKSGKIVWHIQLGKNACTDDDCIYDRSADTIYFFFYRHDANAHWLCILNNQTGEIRQTEFQRNKACGEKIYLYSVLKAEHGVLSYVEAINDLENNRYTSKIFQGDQLLWETPECLAHAKQIDSDQYYTYRLFFDLNTRQVVSFAEQSFPLPIYKLTKLPQGYCMMVCESDKNKLIFTDFSFKKRAEKTVSFADYIYTEDSFFFIKGKSLHKQNK